MSAAACTVEALMFSLRERGLRALQEPFLQQRLSELSEVQLREVCERLQNFKPHIASIWSPDEVGAMIAIWSRIS